MNPPKEQNLEQTAAALARALISEDKLIAAASGQLEDDEIKLIETLAATSPALGKKYAEIGQAVKYWNSHEGQDLCAQVKQECVDPMCAEREQRAQDAPRSLPDIVWECFRHLITEPANTGTELGAFAVKVSAPELCVLCANEKGEEDRVLVDDASLNVQGTHLRATVWQLRNENVEMTIECDAPAVLGGGKLIQATIGEYSYSAPFIKADGPLARAEILIPGWRIPTRDEVPPGAKWTVLIHLCLIDEPQ